MVVRGALLQSLINYWQLDSHGKADSILLELQRWKKGNDDHVLLLPHALQLIERKAWGPALVLLDTLRNSYYRAGRGPKSLAFIALGRFVAFSANPCQENLRFVDNLWGLLRRR